MINLRSILCYQFPCSFLGVQVLSVRFGVVRLTGCEGMMCKLSEVVTKMKQTFDEQKIIFVIYSFIEQNNDKTLLIY
jgi:hypothetical protein